MKWATEIQGDFRITGQDSLANSFSEHLEFQFQGNLIPIGILENAFHGNTCKVAVHDLANRNSQLWSAPTLVLDKQVDLTKPWRSTSYH